MKPMQSALASLLISGSILATAGVQTPAGQTTGAIEFIKIMPGEFMMGCVAGDSQCDDEEKPAHRMRLTKPLELGKYEVTQAQWQAVMGANRSDYNDPLRPVENVSWNDIQSNGRREVMVRIAKGGSWNNGPSSLRISNRGIAIPSERNAFQGFRCTRQALR